VVGVDTHLDTHTAAICDGGGRLLAEQQAPASAAGYGQLLAWARAQAAGAPLIWAVEGAGHYGLNLARHLAAAGQQVAEIATPRTWASGGPGNPTRLMRCGRPGNCSPPRTRPCSARMGTAKRSGF
jgi:hypothetical protein